MIRITGPWRLTTYFETNGTGDATWGWEIRGWIRDCERWTIDCWWPVPMFGPELGRERVAV